MSTIVTRSGKGSPLSHVEVDANFTNLNTDKIQSGNTVAALTITSATVNGGAINGTTIGATTASTGKFSDLTDTGLTSGRVIYATTGGNLTDDADMTFDGTKLTLANDASISGLTVGKGGGAVSDNTSVGYQAGNTNSTGTANTYSGYQAGFTNSTGGAITAFGAGALYANTVGENSAFGRNALTTNTTGTNNTALGQASLNSNTTGNYNAAGGRVALFANTTGSNNTAFGTESLRLNTTASNNTAVGYQAGYSNTTGERGTFIGYQAGYSTTANYAQTMIGFSAGLSTTGANSTFVGYNAGNTITTGAKNTILGCYSGNAGGLDIRTASNYIVLSDGDGNPRGIFDNAGTFLCGKTVNNDTVVGNQLPTNGLPTFTATASTNAASTLNIYSTGAGNYRFYVGMGGTIYATSIVITAISDERLKENIKDIDTGLDSIMALKPRRFDWKDGKGQDKKNAAGFIAQEFETVFPESVGTSKAGEDGIEYKNINHETLIPTLVKAIQELKAEVDSLKQQVGK